MPSNLWKPLMIRGIFFSELLLPLVLSQNQPPTLTFTGTQSVSSMSRSEQKVTQLKTLKCQDTEDPSTRAYLSSLTPSVPCRSCLAVTPCPGSDSAKTQFCLMYTPGQCQLTRPSYLALVECTDDVNEVTGTIDVRLIDNQAPVFLNPSTAFDDDIVRSTELKREGDEIYDVNGEDEEGDAIFYTMTTAPDNGYFEIGYADGKIRAAEDLRFLCEDNVRMSVTMGDTIHPSSVGPRVVSRTFRGRNEKPVFTNTETLVTIDEDPDHEAPRLNAALVFEPQVTDATIYDQLHFKMRAEPERGLEYYHLLYQRGKWKVRPRTRLNYEYEYLRSVRLYFEVTDGFCEAEEFSVVVEIQDVAELPEIVPDLVERTVYEGLIEVDPGWTARDPDTNEILRWSMITNSKDFDVDPVSGIMRSTGEFDLDPKTEEKIKILDVRLLDKDSQRAKARLKLTIVDKNDNAPEFVSKLVKVSASECTKVGALIGKVLAKDQDSEFQGNDQLVYGGHGVNISVLATGDVTLMRQCTAGQTETIQATVTDQGTYPGPLSGVPTSVAFTCNVCPDPVEKTTTASPVPRMEDYPNDIEEFSGPGLALLLSWLIPALLLAALLTAVLAYASWLCCCRRCRDRRKPAEGRHKKHRRNVLPVQTKKDEDTVEVEQLACPEPPPPENDPVFFRFWMETYVDRDQRHMPTRDTVPYSVAKDREVEVQERAEEEMEMEERRRERQRVEEEYQREVEEYEQKLRDRQNQHAASKAPQQQPPPAAPKNRFCQIL
ncbi:uncharacterized protein LOC143290816 [Babylonia areolata]|uniref:uncharacterized protein LOC143290816 n=1 Tax=Babylonia areolata TaxID=304850 RepID=UPI003FD3F06A